VFAVGFLFTDDVRALAKEFPDRKFGCIDYTVDPKDTIPPNLVALKFREEEGSFLVGALAGLLTKTGKVGFVGGMEIRSSASSGGLRRRGEGGEPGSAGDGEVRRTTGAAFKDPTKGKELALAEYHGGATSLPRLGLDRTRRVRGGARAEEAGDRRGLRPVRRGARRGPHVHGQARDTRCSTRSTS